MTKLDDAYANAAYIKDAEAYPAHWEKAAKSFRDSLGARAQEGVSYGPSERQAFDFFQPEGVARGTMIFVHGGYWKAFDRSIWSHLATGALARGWAVAMPSYDLCPDVRIADITRQIAAAVTRVADRTFGPLALAGHSAGGHLVCRMTDPLILPSEIRERIKAIVPISPVADLAPLMDTSMNEILHIDAAEALDCLLHQTTTVILCTTSLCAIDVTGRQLRAASEKQSTRFTTNANAVRGRAFRGP